MKPGDRATDAAFLEDHHRLVEPARPQERPRLATEEAEHERGRSGGAQTSTAKRPERLVVPVSLEEELRSVGLGLDALGLRLADAVLEELAIGVEPFGQPLERLASRPRLAPLDLADVLLREPPGCELGLAQAGRTAQETDALAERGRASVERRLPVLPRHASHGGTLGGA